MRVIGKRSWQTIHLCLKMAALMGKNELDVGVVVKPLDNGIANLVGDSLAPALTTSNTVLTQIAAG